MREPRQMKLLYCVDQWPSLFEHYLYREIHWMRERGHSVSVISLNCAPNGFKNETKDYMDLAKYHLEDVPVLHLDSTQMTMDAMAAEALSFARLQEAREKARDGVVLVVVVRDDRLGRADRFVIRVQVAEVAPAVFVNDLPPRGQPRPHRAFLPGP